MRTLLLLAVLALGCPKPPGPVPPPGPATCDDVCGHLERMGCAIGTACMESCLRLRSQSLKACVVESLTCADADRCDKQPR